MNIEVGKYYANEHVEDDGVKETSIMLILSRDESNPVLSINAETMWLENGQVQDFYLNNWDSSFLQRKATNEEIEIFKEARSKVTRLKTYDDVLDELLAD